MTYLVRAERAGRSWDLHVSENGTYVGVTRVRHFWDAEQQVRDHLESLYGRDVRADRILIYGKHIPIGQNGTR